MQYAWHHFEILESTQTTAIEFVNINSLKTPILITADSQTSGYGTNNRSWQSIKGNLFGTFCVLEADIKLEERFPKEAISIACAHILKNAVEQITGKQLSIKAPNDLTYTGKKCAGILISKVEDVDLQPALCIGIGFNCHKAPRTSQPTIAVKCDKAELIKKFIEILLE